MTTPDRSEPLDLDALFRRLAVDVADVSAEDLAKLSDLDPDALAETLTAIQALDEPARFAFLERLVDMAETYATLDFAAICRACLADASDPVRALAAAGLAFYEDPATIAPLLDLLANDASDLVRSEAAEALGAFALAAAVGGLPPDREAAVVGALREVAADRGEDVIVRASALQSVGAIPADWVRELIHDAYDDQEYDLHIGAIHAMGRSADDYWVPTVVDAMTSADEEERIAAALAAGEIADEGAVYALGELLEDEHEDVVLAAIVGLGEIGGAEATDLLTRYRTHPDPATRSRVEAALTEATFEDDPLGLGRGAESDERLDDEEGW